MVPDHLEVALFSLGNFKDSEARLGLTKGVWRTCVGYAGGVFPEPSYDNIGDHSEAVMAEYAPHTLTYGQLLELFMRWYCAAPLDASPRHAAIIFVRTETERRLAKAAVERGALCGKARPGVRIVPFKSFHRAENACQKHYLRVVTRLYDELMDLYKEEDALLRSTLAARLNGILGQPSASAWRRLPESADLYGLSPVCLEVLRELES